MQLSLLLLVKSVFTGLLALNLSLQILNMKVLLDLGLVLLAFKFSHFLLVFVKLFRVGILQVLHLLRCFFNFSIL